MLYCLKESSFFTGFCSRVSGLSSLFSSSAFITVPSTAPHRGFVSLTTGTSTLWSVGGFSPSFNRFDLSWISVVTLAPKISTNRALSSSGSGFVSVMGRSPDISNASMASLVSLTLW